MVKKELWEKYSINSLENKNCTVCLQDVNNYIIINGNVIVCKNCGTNSETTSKDTYIKSLNEMHLEKDLLLDKILVYEHFVKASPERQNEYDRFKELWEQRKDIRNIDG